MPKINPKTKGAGGEREFCEFLANEFNLEIKPTRNLNQTREGGADIICKPFAFEIKRVETLAYQKWWSQVSVAVRDQKGLAFGLEPVVAFRQNKKDWEFLISAKHIGLNTGYLHIPRHTWMSWMVKYLENFEDNSKIEHQIKDRHLLVGGL